MGLIGLAMSKLHRGKPHGGPGAIRGVLLVSAGALLAAGAPALARQGGNSGRIAQEVVQPLPARDSVDLNSALERLARNPRDVEALIDAGKAALGMGDADAAIGFFGRADQLSPGNARVKAGLAGALVRNENPYDAIPLFEEAERGGGLDSAFTADRGLAYDLVGDNAMAQRYYRKVLADGPNDEATRRLALSLAISGDREGAERTLAPLLSRRDRAAFRTRAFALAIVGQVEDAVGIAHAALSPEMAASMSPYLRYMPRLTKAQQAAAVNFGHFPRASEIGRDDPRVARYAASAARVANAAVASSEGTSAGSSRRGNARSSRRDRSRSAAALPPRALPPEPQVSREITLPATAGRPATKTTGTPAPVPTRRPAPVAPPQRASTQKIVAPPRAAGTVAVSTTRGTMGPALSETASSTRTSPASSSAQLATAATPPRSVADAFGDFARPVPGAAPTQGAVDISKITPARPKPKAEAKPKVEPKPPAPSHPSRIWVQVATGRDKDALGFDWRRMARAAPEAFRDKKANVSAWGQNNRLLAGPFPTEAAATAFIAQLRRTNINGPFVWTSPAGQVVDALPAG